MSEIGAPREALGEWMKIRSAGRGGYEAVLEDHFGEAHAADLLARCVLAVLSDAHGGALASLHVDWLAPALPATAVMLHVARLEADAARSEVRVSAAAPLCRATAEITGSGGGPAYQDAAVPPGLPPPESLPSTLETARKEGWPEAYAAGPVEFRRVGPLRPDRGRGESSDLVSWLALRAPLPDDPALAQAALVFLAAFYPHWEFERRLGERFDAPSFALRSHTLWLHRAVRPEGWLLLRAGSRICAGGRALGARELFARDGTLLASVASEARVAAA